MAEKGRDLPGVCLLPVVAVGRAGGGIKTLGRGGLGTSYNVQWLSLSRGVVVCEEAGVIGAAGRNLDRPVAVQALLWLAVAFGVVARDDGAVLAVEPVDQVVTVLLQCRVDGGCCGGGMVQQERTDVALDVGNCFAHGLGI